MIFLAPLQGYTDYVFRNTYHRHFGGIDLAVTPFVSLTQGKRIKLNHIRDVLPENNEGMPLVPQVMGREPDLFITMARAFEEMGYTSVNWNLGCPIRSIARKKRGSGILPYPDEIDKILSEIIPKISIRLSIKTRLGYQSADEADKIMEVYNRYPLEYLIIHPRTGIQLYDGEVDLKKFRYCLDISKNPVVYSGDIWNEEIFSELTIKYPKVEHWMLGRGLFRDLFLAEKISGKYKHEIRHDQRFWDFQVDLLQNIIQKSTREKSVLNRMKEYWTECADMFRERDEILEMIYPVKEVQELEKKLELIKSNYRLI